MSQRVVQIKDDAVNSLKIDFCTPIKNEQHIYIANLVEPLVFKLPKNLKIYSTGKNTYGDYEIWYLIDLNKESNEKLISFLHNLDDIALDNAYNNSNKWFGKKLRRGMLEKLYRPIYDSDKNNNIYIKFVIKNKQLLEKFNLKHYSMIKINGLQFFKNRFTYLAIINNVINNIDIDNTNIDFIECLSNNLEQDYEKKADIEEVIYENNSLHKSSDVLSNNNEIRKALEIDNVKSQTSLELNNDIPIKDIEVQTIKSEFDNHLSDKSNNDTCKEEISINKTDLQDMISEKRLHCQKCFINAEKANRAAENLRLKAIKASSELKEYEKNYTRIHNLD